MAKSSSITQQDIKLVIKKQVTDDVRQLRRELVLQRINVNKVVGVGNMDDYINEWELDFINSSNSASKKPQPKNKKLKRITKTKRNPKL